MNAIVVAGALYAIPKTLTYLCTKPDPVQGRIDSIRAKFAAMQQLIQESLDRRIWFIATDVLADNAWASFLLTEWTSQGGFADLARNDPVTAVYVFAAFASGCVCVRYVVGKYFPALRPYIATRTGEAYGS